MQDEKEVKENLQVEPTEDKISEKQQNSEKAEEQNPNNPPEQVEGFEWRFSAKMGRWRKFKVKSDEEKQRIKKMRQEQVKNNFHTPDALQKKNTTAIRNKEKKKQIVEQIDDTKKEVKTQQQSLDEMKEMLKTLINKNDLNIDQKKVENLNKEQVKASIKEIKKLPQHAESVRALQTPAEVEAPTEEELIEKEEKIKRRVNRNLERYGLI